MSPLRKRKSNHSVLFLATACGYTIISKFTKGIKNNKEKWSTDSRLLHLRIYSHSKSDFQEKD